MEITISKATQEENEQFQNSQWGNVDIEHWGHEVEWPIDVFYFKATDEDGTTVGAVNGRHEAGVIYVDDIIVTKELRGQKVGTKLMEHLETWGKSVGAHKIFLFTKTEWEASVLYEKLGYKEAGILERHYLKTDFIIYHKFIG